MKCKLGALVTQASGSVGGHTIQHSKGGMQIRKKPLPRPTISTHQYFIRSINFQLKKAWVDLTPSQRAEWTLYAISHKILSEGLNPHILSGQALFYKYNGYLLNYGFSLISNPFLWSYPYLGSELVTNGDFLSDTDWSKDPGWLIIPPNSVADAGPYKYIRQPMNTDPGKTYVCICNIVSIQSGFPIFSSATFGSTLLVPGRIGYHVQHKFCTINGNNFLFGTSSYGLVGIIDFLSIKEVL